MTPLDLKTIDAALTGRARELTRSLAVRREITVERSADEFDDALLAAGRESSAQILSGDLRLLRQIEAAQSRLRNGTFGICLRCEEPITPKRLQAVPWAAYCLSCQADAEAGGGAGFALSQAA